MLVPKLFFIFLLLASTTNLEAQTIEIRNFIFGHSLIDHRPPAIPTPSNETTVPHWIYLLAEAAGHKYSAGGQYGFLPQHADLPPFSQWGYDIVPGVWESDTESFSDADITTSLITAANFAQWQGPRRRVLSARVWRFTPFYDNSNSGLAGGARRGNYNICL